MKQLLLSILLAIGASAAAANNRPVKIWNHTGPLGETPKHVTDAFPLSDQQNKGQWVKFEPMSDEFEGKELDLEKWALGIVGWKGRQPALFSDKNVTVSDGKLHLTMRKAKLPAALKKQGYHDYTSAALHSKARTAYGYFEVKAKPMNSTGSSSFWFVYDYDGTVGNLTEIDVFEIGGKAKGFERKYNMNLHAWKDGPRTVAYVDPGPKSNEHAERHGEWVAPWRLADDYHVYGFDWGKDEIKWYVDGVLVRSVENAHWHQPLHLTFDSETMPDWFGMPDDKDLPSTFSVEYVRAWKRDCEAKTLWSLESGRRTDTFLALATLSDNGFAVPKIQYDKPYAEAWPKLRKLAEQLRQLPAAKLADLDKSLKYHWTIYPSMDWPIAAAGWKE